VNGLNQTATLGEQTKRMPTKASLNPDAAKQGGSGGVEAGKYRVKAARTQNIKTDWKPNQLHLVFTLETLGSDGKVVRDEEEKELKASFGEKSLKNFHPGQAKDANDNDPTDQGDAVDATGNTAVVVGDDPFNKSCSALVLMESLKKQGFPKEILDRFYTPDFAGLEFELATYTPKECNDKFGMRLNTKVNKDADGKEINVSYKVAVRWLNPTYLNGVQSSTPAANNNEVPVADESASTDELTKLALQAVVETKKGSSIKSAQALFGFVTNVYAQSGGKTAAIKTKLPAKRLQEVQKRLDDKLWVSGIMAEFGAVGEYDSDGNHTGVYNIPA